MSKTFDAIKYFEVRKINKIEKVLKNEHENYIFPFLWMHGESDEKIREYVTKIYDSGIRALCVEPRPHPDFVGEHWWKDLRVVLDEAKSKEMKVWLFDDAHFPTGYANGAIIAKYPELRKKYLKINQLDFSGPQKDAGIIVKWMAGGDRKSIMAVGTDNNQLIAELAKEEEKIIAVLAAKVADFQTIDSQSVVDISDLLIDGTVYWDVPPGIWRVFTLVETFNGGEASTEGYLNPIDPLATQVLIDTVYEAHLNNVGEYFGNTIAGFFTDEPRFGNIKGPDASIGRTEMVLPWKDGMLELLTEEYGENTLLSLPLLTCNGEESSRIRFVYMNIVSKLYSENFCDKLANWCVNHGLEYTGHLIEDNNAHARLGYGAGHYFRGTDGQTISGVDVVLHQLLPDMDQGYFKTFTGSGWDGEFFHYVLAKLGSSFAHLDEKKAGRSMVELYGAYGWSEGINLMKWMTDHMLVRGINHFVPHAFNMAPFPDADCPPHFYAHGNNPQFRFFKLLMDYTNRVAELISEGTHKAQSLILYHAEAEWSGEYMLNQKPAKVLTQNQIDFDIIPADYLSKVNVVEEALYIHNETFATLIIPYSERLPIKVLTKLKEIAEKGARLLFLEAFPTGSSEGTKITDSIEVFKKTNCEIVELEDLADYYKKNDFLDLKTSNFQPNLRYYHYEHEDSDVHMFFNESGTQSILTEVKLAAKHPYTYQYDPMENTIVEVEYEADSFTLFLAPQESVFYLSNEKEIQADRKIEMSIIASQKLTEEFQVSFASYDKYPQFGDKQKLKKLRNVNSPEWKPDFSGTIRYEYTLDINKKEEVHYRLDLGETYEVAEVFVNGKSCGVRFSKPYHFDVTNELHSGINDLVFEITTNLGASQKDFLSQYRLLQPSGIVEQVSIVEMVDTKNLI